MARFQLNDAKRKGDIYVHQLAFPLVSALRKELPVHKIALEDTDLQTVTDLICDGIQEGLYKDIILETKRSDVLVFLRRLAVLGEIEEYDPMQKRFRSRAAALVVYSVDGITVGFGVLAQTTAKSKGHGVELLMLGVAPMYRGIGYGAAILNNLVKNVSQHGFFLMVKCPSNCQLLFAMLVTRGFLAVDRYLRGRVLQLVPFGDRRGHNIFAISNNLNKINPGE